MNPTTITTDLSLWFHARATDLRRRLAELTKSGAPPALLVHLHRDVETLEGMASRWARQTHDHPTTETTR